MNKLFFCGDIVLENSELKKLVGNSLREIITECEVVCGNLEGSIPEDISQKLPKKGPHLYQQSNVVNLLKEAGFTIMLGANNHIMDFGYFSAKKTKDILSPIEIIGFGESSEEVFKPYVYTMKNHTTIAILSVAEGGFGAYYEEYSNFGYAHMCGDRVKNIIEELSQKYDFLFVCCHAGAENLIVPLPEIRKLYHSYVDWGAAAVIGSHPHVAQGVEEYQDGVIIYSTGNFCFKDSNEFDNPCSMAVLFDLTTKTLKFDIVPIKATKDGVVLCEDQVWMEELEHRTKQLFEIDEYIQMVEQFCVDQYKSFYCQSFVGAAGNLFYNTFKDRVRSVFNLITNNTKIHFDNTWIKHNYLVETHRWVITRALKVIERNKK